MTHSTRREDREQLQRPVATSEEFAEFLKYADDLAAMRLRGDEVRQLMAIFMVGGFLWAFGIGFRLIEFAYGVFYLVCVGVTFVSILWWKLRSRCPRCKGKFGHPVSIRISTFGFGVRLAPTSETCEQCGLRSLSRYDITRFLAERSEDGVHQNANECRDEISIH
jgi:hypothetical protein